MKMRKNLLAMLLAVVMIAAVVFIAAPNAQAATVTASKDNDVITVAAGDTVDLNGCENVTINVTNGGAIYLVDSANLEKLDGTKSGSAILGENVTLAESWVQHTDNFKYLAVKDGNTYSAHPFNLTIDKIGVNTHFPAIAIRAVFIADDTVARLIHAGSFGLHNHTVDPNTDEVEFTPYTRKTFVTDEGVVNGIEAYFFLEGSLSSTVLENNVSNTFSAYITLDAGYGEITIDSNTQPVISPKGILEDLNNKVVDEPDLFDADKKAKMVELIKKTQNEDKQFYFAAYCGNFLKSEGSSSAWTLVTDASTLKVGDQIIIAANGYDFALSTTQNDNNRGKAPVTKNGDFIEFGDDVQILTLEAGTADGTFAFKVSKDNYLYCASTSSKNYLRTQSTVDEKASWAITITDGTATIKSQVSNIARNLLQYNNLNSIFACYSSAQQAIAIYKTSSACTNHELKEAKTFAPTCTEDGYTLYVCLECGATNKAKSGKEATGHSFNEEISRTNATCTTAGSIITQCANCETTQTTSINPLGHKWGDDNKCTNENCNETKPAGQLDVLATFEFGANGTASHKDGSSVKTTYTETNGGYTLNLTAGSKMYPSSYDAKGNSCIKLGTSSAVGGFSFTVPDNITSVEIHIAKYKTNTTKVSIGGTISTLTKNSDNGEYDVITIDTSVTKTISLTTVSGGVRAMVNTIVFNGVAK